MLKEGNVKLNDVKEIIMDRIYLYNIDDLENNLCIGYIKNMPPEYLDLQIKIIGAKRKGIIDIGVVLSTYEKNKLGNRSIPYNVGGGKKERHENTANQKI